MIINNTGEISFDEGQNGDPIETHRRSLDQIRMTLEKIVKGRQEQLQPVDGAGLHKGL